MTLAAHWAPIARPLNRRVAIALGAAALVHVALFSLMIFTTRAPTSKAPPWASAIPVTLVRWPRPLKRATAKAQSAPSTATRRRTRITTPGTPSVLAPVTAPTETPSASAPKARVAAPTDETGAAMRGALRGLGACRPSAVGQTDRERAACDERLRRLADAAPPIHKRPPAAPAEPSQKAGECRFNVKMLLSPHVKCKFW